MLITYNHASKAIRAKVSMDFDFPPLDSESELSSTLTPKAAERAHLIAKTQIIPTEADWVELARNLPLLLTVLGGQSLGRSGDRRSRRASLVGSILNRRPSWAPQAIADRFRPSLEAYDGKHPSNPHKVEELIQEILGWCDEFEKGEGKAFSSDELRIVARRARRQGASDTEHALEALIDAEPGRPQLIPLTVKEGTECGRFLAKTFPRRSIRALYDTLNYSIGDLRHPFSQAALKAWEGQRGAFPALVTVAVTASSGLPLKTESNAISAAFELGFPLAFDERRQQMMVQGPLPWDPVMQDRPFRDDDYGLLSRYVAERYHLHCPTKQWAIAIETYAAQNSYDPVRDYLMALPPWDGVLRWPTILTELMGQPAEDLLDIHHMCMVRWAVGCIARALQPGCKNDTMLVLIGEQGFRKTTFGKALMADPTWFLESYNPKAHDKDSLMAMHSGAWLLEHGELAALRAGQVEEIKAFLSTTHDTFRKPYARIVVQLPRRSAAIGTANDRGSGLFRDPTGSRRFWPVPINRPISTEAVEGVRDQLWAEALHHYREGVEWWLIEEENIQLVGASEMYQLYDAVSTDIDLYLNTQRKKLPPNATRLFVTTREILAATGHLPPYQRADQMRVAELLKQAGGVKGRHGKQDERGYWFPAAKT